MGVKIFMCLKFKHVIKFEQVLFMRKEEYPRPERCFKKTISRVSQFLHPKDPHVKFYKYSTEDFIMRYKTIDKSHG
jgi:hypothetical protein